MACAICPEVWKVRKPTSNAEKTALASGSVKFSIRTNASGNAGIYVFLQQLTGPASSYVAVPYTSTSFISDYTSGATGFNPATGGVATPT